MSKRKVALVTGGSRGIGRGISIELGRLGWAVMVNFNEDLSAASEARTLVEEAGGEAELCQGDITARSHRDLIVEYTLERFGRVDLLVNNAGIAPAQRKDVLETDAESFDRILDSNLRSPFFLSQRVARLMIEQVEHQRTPPGAIVNISGIESYTAAPEMGEYCISKAGLSMVTKLFAARLARHGINVYEICPGVFKTDMTTEPELYSYYSERISKGLMPISRWGEPEEVGRAVAAIARGDFPFTTGAVLHVDGGWHLRKL